MGWLLVIKDKIYKTVERRLYTYDSDNTYKSDNSYEPYGHKSYRFT